MERTNNSVEKIPVVLMAGGAGSRLHPLTENCPKPLLKVGGKPILERIIESLAGDGFKNFYLSVHYKAEMIEDHFGDGTGWGVTINYLRETQLLGTAGSLRLLPQPATDSLIVMNGDLLTDLSLSEMLQYHKYHKASATMAVAPYHVQIPYGVVQTNDELLISIQEKPVHLSHINAGIYILEPEALEHLPADGPYDMPSLFEKLIQAARKTCAFLLPQEWIDIGSLETFEKVSARFSLEGCAPAMQRSQNASLNFIALQNEKVSVIAPAARLVSK